MCPATTQNEPSPTQQAAMATLIEIVHGALWSTCLTEIAELQVADVLGDTAETATELASKVGANANALERVLRLLATKGVFEDLDGRFRHTASSRLLRADHPQSMRGFARLAIPTRPLLGAFSHTLRTGRPAVEAVDPDGLWAYLVKNPAFARIFDEGMTSKANMDIAGVLRAYDFSKFASIADIGGGRGHLIKAVLEAAPNSKGVLFDLPHVIDGAKTIASSRLSLQAGDFFKDPLPVCDAYLLMHVIHDWDDRDSLSILSAVRRVVPSSAKVLLIEMLMPETPQPHPSVFLDTLMMAYATGQERKRNHYQALLEAAGLRLDRVIPTESAMAILESTPV